MRFDGIVVTFGLTERCFFGLGRHVELPPDGFMAHLQGRYDLLKRKATSSDDAARWAGGLVIGLTDPVAFWGVTAFEMAHYQLGRAGIISGLELGDPRLRGES